MSHFEGDFPNGELCGAESGRIVFDNHEGECVQHVDDDGIYFGISKSSQLAGRPSENIKAHEQMSRLPEEVRCKGLSSEYYWRKIWSFRAPPVPA